MQRIINNLSSRNQTGKMMKKLINTFSNDIDKIAVKKNGNVKAIKNMSLFEFFNIVKNIPYRKDTAPVEVISRPAHILKLSKLGMDCKKKSILMCSFCKQKNIPFRLIASSKKINHRIHHVFPQAKINGKWKNIDATYNHYKIFEPKKVTYAVQL